MLANPDTKKSVGIKIVSPRQGHFGQKCRHLAVGATCRRHVGNFLSQAGRRHSVKSAYFFADKVVSGNRIPDTLFYMWVGIGTIHFWYVPRLPCMQQHNLSRTQPRTMSDDDICSNDEKYGGFGAMMANSLRCQEEPQEERE
jgi:hypothetical protein